MTSSSDQHQQQHQPKGPWTREEATRKTAENLGCTVEDLENASKLLRELDEKERRESSAWKKMDEIIGELKLYHTKTRYNPNLPPIIEKLERFKEQEL